MREFWVEVNVTVTEHSVFALLHVEI